MTVENFIQRDSAGERLASALLLWTARAQQTLWTALDAEQQYRCMESFAEEFER